MELTGRLWTAGEDSILRDTYSRMDTFRLAVAMNRSVGALRFRAHLLDLKKEYQIPFTSKEIEFLHENGRTMTRRAMAGALGKPLSTVDKLCRKLGVPRRETFQGLITIELGQPPNKRWNTSLGEGLTAISKRLHNGLRRKGFRDIVEAGDIYNAGYLLMCAYPGLSWYNCERDLYQMMLGARKGTARHGGRAHLLGLAYNLLHEFNQGEEPRQ